MILSKDELPSKFEAGLEKNVRKRVPAGRLLSTIVSPDSRCNHASRMLPWPLSTRLVAVVISPAFFAAQGGDQGEEPRGGQGSSRAGGHPQRGGAAATATTLGGASTASTAGAAAQGGALPLSFDADGDGLAVRCADVPSGPCGTITVQLLLEGCPVATAPADLAVTAQQRAAAERAAEQARMDTCFPTCCSKTAISLFTYGSPSF